MEQLLTDYFIEALTALFIALLSPVAYRIYAYLGIKRDDRQREYLREAIYFAVSYGVELAKENFDDIKRGPVRDDIIYRAVNYLHATVPDALRRFRLSDEKLEAMLKARLPDFLDK